MKMSDNFSVSFPVSFGQTLILVSNSRLFIWSLEKILCIPWILALKQKWQNYLWVSIGTRYNVPRPFRIILGIISCFFFINVSSIYFPFSPHFYIVLTTVNNNTHQKQMRKCQWYSYTAAHSGLSVKRASYPPF